MPIFERATFGNKDGSHQLLNTTVAAETSALDQLRFLVDRPAGHVDSSVTWSPYWGCQPVDLWWVLWRGEEDIDAPRRNMVRVEVVLVPLSQCALVDNLDELLAAVGHTEDDRSLSDALQMAGNVVHRLSTTGAPVAIPGIGLAPDLLRALWPRLWPSARASLSLRTVFAAESLTCASPPKIAVFPVELKPRWRNHALMEEREAIAGPASRWFSGEPSPLFERLLEANLKQLPGELSVLVRVERIVERLERLHAGKGTISDALVVARTQEAFSGGFTFPREDLEVVSKALANFGEASAGDIRTASLTRLVQFSVQGEVEAALAAWIQPRLPESADQDALWILQCQLSQDHAQWWRDGVSRGLVAAFKQRRPEWARALWRWWALQPTAIDWVADYLDGSAAVENWLAKDSPKDIHGDLLKKVLEVCRARNWATLLARTLGSGRPLVECIGTMRKALLRPEEGMPVLLADRVETEIVTAAAETNWHPVIARAAEITRIQPMLLGRLRGMPGLVPLLLEHLRGGGEFPSDLIEPDFIVTVFDGVLQRDQQLLDVAGFLKASAGAFALDHSFADKLLGKLNPEVISGAAAEWCERFMADDSVGTPPSAIRSAVINSVRVFCEGASVTQVIRLLHLLPEVPEEMFVEWMKHTGLFWGKDDHARMATLLVQRNWRKATKAFRYSWKRELQVVAWYAHELLPVLDTLWWGAPSEVGATAVEAPISINNARQKMKITFLASNPTGSSRLALDEEARLIEEKVRGSKHRDLVTFKTRWAVRPEDLQQVLLEDEPVIVHFSGHGGGAVGILLHSQDQGDQRLVAEKALTDLFRVLKDDIRVVVLNACYSEVQATAIVQEIDFVIGMSDSVGDEAARVFAAAFYRGLAFGRSVKNAFDLGLNDLRLAGLGQEDHIPKLLVRSGVDSSTTVLVGGRLT